MATRDAVKLAVGVLVIGGTFAVLWAFYGPSIPGQGRVAPLPPPPLLESARVSLRVAGPAVPGGRRHASIECDGIQRKVTGFWAGDPVEACEALAATRTALLEGASCRRKGAGRMRLVARGAFGRRAFHRVQQQGGCPDPDDWLAVDALVRPLMNPEQKLGPRQAAS